MLASACEPWQEWRRGRGSIRTIPEWESIGEDQPYRFAFVGLNPVFDVVACAELPVGLQNFGDRYTATTWILGREQPTVGQVFGHQPVVEDSADSGAVRPEVVVPASDGDNGLTAGAMLPILGQRLGETRHKRCSLARKTVSTVLALGKNAARPTIG